MMAPLKINGAGNPISAAMGMYITIKTKSIDEPGVRLFMHPHQTMCIANIPGMAILVHSPEDFKGPFPHKFCGLEIVEDAQMRDDEIQWRDKDGGLVAKITGLAT